MTKGQRIVKARLNAGLNATDLAEKIGVSKQTLYKYENDIITNIPSDKIEAIANECGTTPAFIMGWENYVSTEHYYIDEKARELAQFLYSNPQYNVLFDATRNVKPEDIGIVKALLDKFKG